MPIEFLDILDDDGWEPLSPETSKDDSLWGGSVWSDGSALDDAPVDVAATFEGAAWRSNAIDPAFGLSGVRLRAGFVVPRHDHSRSLLLLVFGGRIVLRADEGDGHTEAQLGVGQFCVIDADTGHSLVAGDQGATLLGSWPLEAPELVTRWYPDPAWVSAAAESSGG